MSRRKLPTTRRLRIKADFVVEFDREIGILPMHPRELFPKLMTAAGEALAPHGAQYILSAPFMGYVGRDTRKPWPTAVRLTFTEEKPTKHLTVSPFWWVVKDGEKYLDVYGNKTRRQRLARVFYRRSIAEGWCAPGIADRVVRVKARAR